jgi:hypothetical protein
MGEANGYVVTLSSCPSALSTDANVENDAPVVLLYNPFRLSLTSSLKLGDDSCRLHR